MEQISDFLKQFGVMIAVGMVGMGIVVYGLWVSILPEKSTVEIVKESENQDIKGEIVADIAGAVERPGVYKLPSGSRIGDALVLAGGLSASADREWVAQTINLAEVVKDAQKIYVPGKSDNLNTQSAGISETRMSQKINVNTASMGELDGLPEIGESRAKAIIDNRPYGRIEDLVSRAKIPQSVYEQIKDSISIY